MKLDSLRMRNFGGIESRDISFDPERINLFVGQNETGKSTIVEAIFHALLTPVLLNKLQWEKSIAELVPLGQRRQPEVVLEYTRDTTQYRVTKKWPLVLSQERVDGSLSVEQLDTRKIVARSQDELNRLLPLSPATMRTLAIQLQDQGSNFHQDLKTPGALRHSLEESLRERIFSVVPGFSLSRFKARLEEKIAEYCSNWDSREGLPKKHRGIHNPWKKNVGIILGHYYEWRRAVESLEEARSREKRLDTARQEADRLRTDCAEQRQKRDELSKKSMHLLQQTEDERDELRREKLTETRTRWQECIQEQRKLVGDAAKEEAEEKYLDEQYRLAQDKKKLEKIQALEELRVELRSLSAPDPATAKTLQKVEAAIQKYRTLHEESLFTLRVTAKKESKLTLRIAPDTEEIFSLEAHAMRQIDVPPSFSLKTSDLDITLGKAHADPEAERQEWQRAIATQKEILQRFDAAKSGELFERAQKAKILKSSIDDGEEKLREIVDEESQKALQKQAARLATVEEDAVIAEKRGAVAAKRKEIAQTLKDLEQEEADYIAQHESLKKLCDIIDKELRVAAPLQPALDLPQTDHEDLRGDLDALEKSIQAAEAAYETARASSEQLQHEWLQALGDHNSREDLESEVQKKHRAFEAAAQHGTRLLELQDIVGETEAGAQQSMFTPYKALFTEKFTSLSNRRYRVNFEELDAQALRQNESIATSMLSSGTQSVFALAARLASLELLLPDAGFLVLDDLFVHLDAERQHIAAGMLETLAKRYQILLFSFQENLPGLFSAPRVLRFSARI